MNLNNDTPELEEEELFEHHRHVADKGQSLLRVDKFLMQLIANATRNKIQKAAEDGNIWVNDIPVKSNYRVKPLDVVRVMLSHQVESEPLRPYLRSIVRTPEAI